MIPTRGYAKGPYGQIHYQDTVEGDVPLILCSQSPLTSRQFDKVYPLLAEAGIRAIGIDTPGFGMSDPPPKAPFIEDYAKIFPSLMEHFGFSSAHVGGHHTGCKIVMEAAIQFSNQVSSVILSGPGPMTREEQQGYIDTALKTEMEFAPKADGSHLSDMFTRRLPWVEKEPDGLDLCTGYVIQPLMGKGPFWYGHHAAFNYDGAEAMQKLTQPTLALFNTGDVLYAYAEKTMTLCPHFTYAEIEGGGIDITDTHPEAWVEHVAAYIKGVEKDLAAP